MSRSPSRTTASLALVAALAATVVTALPAAAEVPWPWRSKFAAGEQVRFAGTLSDSRGAPLVDVEVAVEAWRSGFDLRGLAWTRDQRTRATTRTNARGEFTIDWTWEPELRKFALVAYLPYRGSSGPTEYELARADVSGKLRDGSPVTATLVADAAAVAFLERLRAFEASLATADERAIYQDLGLPERVDTTNVGGGDESAWWYYAQGRVVRFRDGRRTEVQTFPPVSAEAAERR
jgi:hypothetical protein